MTLELDDGCSIVYFALVVVASRREFYKATIEVDDLQRRRNKCLSFVVLLLLLVEMLQNTANFNCQKRMKRCIKSGSVGCTRLSAAGAANTKVVSFAEEAFPRSSLLSALQSALGRDTSSHLGHGRESYRRPQPLNRVTHSNIRPP